MPGAAVYAWHCDRDGRYSLDDVEDQNHLRGVQAADASGDVTSTSIFPPAHSGRRPHVHFEVHTSLAEATAPTNVITSAQLALPKAIHDGVYATDGYVASVANMARTSLTWDMVGHGLRRRRREDPAGHDAPGLTTTGRASAPGRAGSGWPRRRARSGSRWSRCPRPSS